jgi:hypothetical protein
LETVFANRLAAVRVSRGLAFDAALEAGRTLPSEAELERLKARNPWTSNAHPPLLYAWEWANRRAIPAATP